jgi:hypothetical protein
MSARGLAARRSTVPQGVEFALWWLHGLLRVVGAAERDYVLFGSAVLWLHGIRDEIGDVDVFVTGRVWGALWDLFQLEDDKQVTVETPRAGDPPFLSIPLASHPIHVFFDWSKRDEWLSVPDAFASAETVGGWRCVPLEMLRAWKATAHAENIDSARHQKHADDLVLIDAHLARVS